MWIYNRPRNEHDNRFLLNLDHGSRINVNALGEHWFVEVMLGSEAIPIASTDSQEEAIALQKRIFEGLKAGEKALDLGDSAEEGKPPEKNSADTETKSSDSARKVGDSSVQRE